MNPATLDFTVETRARFFSLMNHKGLAILKGLPENCRIDSDREELFRQDSNFFYLTGVNEPDCWAVLDLTNKCYHLFMPRIPEDYKVWMTVLSLEEKNARYHPDVIHYTEELKTVVGELARGMTADSKVFVLNYMTHEQEAELALPATVAVDHAILREVLHESRVCKTPAEITIMREASRIASEGFKEVLRQLRPGMKEYELEALWLAESYKHGGPHAKLQAYNPICAAGKMSATLHYVDNNKVLNEGELFLLDAGNEFRNYAADITRSFPASGHFTPQQRVIYDIVLRVHKTIIEHMRPGVDWTDMHRLSMRVTAEGLLAAGFLKGTVDELLANHVVALFYMHGLGHQLGLDVHDVGGYPKGVERIQEPGIRSLRTRRILAPGMVLTVEPGIYFKDALLEPALHDEKYKRFLNEEKIREYWNFGGIRIEDDVLVTETGHESLTHVPKEAAEVEAFMLGARRH
eukprot:GAFH01001596.1.p2 GENE.GAFH01001596.1~~GAFH01001596.1.p2  ORF type:complete len:471 (-),score=173.32 GAFH01001596.1:118-1506(-)